eukprot:m.183292 g.183292  ORF g.183292 m.183292 type:complete len:284 (-) comp53495_c0_seq5:611-1462(-)
MSEPWTLHGILAPADRPAPSLWYVLEHSGTGPSARLGHGVVSLGFELLLFGGADPSGAFNDLNVLNLETHAWSKLAASSAPSARYDHAMLALPNPRELAVLFGSSGASLLNDLHVFNRDSNSWRAVTASGIVPAARTFHHIARVGTRAFVFGGGSQGTDAVEDSQLHVLDLEQFAWSQPAVRGSPPSLRHGHIMCAVGPLVLVHGMTFGMLFSLLWRDARIHRSGGPALVGGMNGPLFFHDLHVFDTGSVPDVQEHEASWSHFGLNFPFSFPSPSSFFLPRAM